MCVFTCEFCIMCNCANYYVDRVVILMIIIVILLGKAEIEFVMELYR